MDNPHVLLETSLGEILLELYPEKAPRSVANFLQYVDDGHYDKTLFHRVVRGFVIQGGGYDLHYQKKPTRDPIPNEAANGLPNVHGAVAMARSQDKDSAMDEFFINAADNPGLDHEDETDEGYGYAVFGQVVEGLDVVKKINWKVTKPRPEHPELPELPVDDIILRSAMRYE